MILQFQEEIPFPKNLLVAERRILSLLVHTALDIALYLAGQTGAERDDALMVRLQHFIINTGFIIKSIDEALRHDLHQVLITLVVLGQQHQMIVAVLPVRGFSVKSGTGRHIYLASDDGFDSHLSGRPVEIDHAVHDAMVRDSHAVHAQLFCPRRQLLNLTGAV